VVRVGMEGLPLDARCLMKEFEGWESVVAAIVVVMILQVVA
jgi:hypothetical protein